MLLSVFTPSHDVRYLDDAYRSLTRQVGVDWEWIVLLNGRATRWEPPTPDDRVKVSRAKPGVKGVGALKRAACALTTGDLLVELDHDDRLSRGCLAQIVDAFADPGIVLAYSDWAQINADGSANHDHFDPDAGWTYSHGTFDGRHLDRSHAMAATPHNVGYIWYAPNHVRAFRRSSYDEVGGYDAELPYLDDQDLMCRLFQVGDFAHIDRCLYIQRMHSRMTQSQAKINADIQERTVVMYRRYIDDLALAWARRRGLRALRLRTPTWIGDEPDDRYEDVVVDPARPEIPVDPGTVGVLKVWDVLQRVPERVQLFNTMHAALAHGGLACTQTPSTDGRGAFQDPSSVAFYNENSFMYFTQKALAAAVPDLTGRFQISHLNTFYPSSSHEELDIAYVQANLLAIKDGARQGGPLLC